MLNDLKLGLLLTDSFILFSYYESFLRLRLLFIWRSFEGRDSPCCNSRGVMADLLCEDFLKILVKLDSLDKFILNARQAIHAIAEPVFCG